MSDLLVFAAAGAGLWALRASAIVPAGGRVLPEPTTRALGYARHAVLAALITAAVAGGHGVGGLVTPSPQLAAAIVAGAVAWWTGGMLRTAAAGIGTVLLLSSW